MTITELLETASALGPVEAALMDTARSLQLTLSMHEEATRRYEALARHVDRSGSPLEDDVAEVYPSGSFAIHAAIRSKIKRDQHDVDAVLEISLPLDTKPSVMLDKLYSAIVNTNDERYRGLKVERNSRCVTVHYSDGVTVDLMPVVRLPGTPERVANLFHDKLETGESYTKEVNPSGFASHFNRTVQVSMEFARRFETRRLLVDGQLLADGHVLVEKAETQLMPTHLPLERKSPRVVALQLLKCFRDKRYRKHGDHMGRRKPPSVVMAALALDAPLGGFSLTDEVLAIATTMRDAIVAADRRGGLIEVRNPAHQADEFTDRWPEDRTAQQLWAADLRHFVTELTELQRHEFEPVRVKRVFDDLFGSALADHILEEHAKAQNHSILGGASRMSSDGKLHSPAIGRAWGRAGAKGGVGLGVGAGLIVPARANTSMGGWIPPE
ncbi:nucleotidyltransferase [Novosphingopyxis sp.]|uniref:nucleotidyltransferase domain-containing protein n=1 Tax=Novosphingopyxis sp. TaxID=2709690 RepID=UPI003B5B61AB